MYHNRYQGNDISALGFGSLRLPTEGGDPNHIDRMAAKELIDYAIKNGINYFDAAYTYHKGDSEKFLGETLSQYPRDHYYLASKFYVAAGIDVQEMFEEQIRRSQTDHFDFYLLHGVNEKYYDAYTDREKNCLRYLLVQKEEGRIRHLGFSSHAAPETLNRFLDWYDGFDMAMIQLNYVDWKLLNAKEQYEILTRHGLPVWVMEPLKGGRLSTLNEKACEILKAAAPERSISSWGFRFLMGLPNVQTVLSGMSTMEQVKDNIATFSHYDPLSPTEQKALADAAATFIGALGVPCSACRYCCDTCPADLDIPWLIRGYNEYSVSGELWRLGGSADSFHPEACLQCGACAKRCPQNINVPEVLLRFSSLRQK